ncbi:DUF397 domain-containing protein [Streptomyces sp. NPDC058953]|uniref:DUF397 domain-containing protein n=1 Tax=unclassified Streptomyces TaxID=2593676 RepID=UPI00369E3CA3
MSSLYDLPLQGAEFHSFCGGNLGGEHESCVEIGVIPGAVSAFVLRDNKPEGAGVELRFTAKELNDFVRGYARMQGLTL